MLECGGENVHHYYVGMPDYDAVQLAPSWASWSCVFGPQDRGCDDCGFQWCLPGGLEGFRNVWEVLVYYDVRALHELGSVFAEQYDPAISVDLVSGEIGLPGLEALVLNIGQREERIPFPFSTADLLGTFDALADENAGARDVE